jgi:hypothetical protein
LHHLLKFDILILAALVISIDIAEGKTERNTDNQQPIDLEFEHAQNKHSHPNDGCGIENRPKDGLIKLVDHSIIIGAFKDPFGIVVVHLIPPSQAHQQSSRDVLDDPKVRGQQQYTRDGQCNKVRALFRRGSGSNDPPAKDVQRESRGFEDTMKDTGRGMRRFGEAILKIGRHALVVIILVVVCMFIVLFIVLLLIVLLFHISTLVEVLVKHQLLYRLALLV